jgi:mannose-6-phosphate isomerase-like protein (cupin superfamily)
MRRRSFAGSRTRHRAENRAKMAPMQLLIVGTDPEGRSCVTERTDVAPAAIPGITGSAMASLYTTDQSPPAPGPPGLGPRTNSVLPPGHISCFVVEHAPRGPSYADLPPTTELHWRNALEIVVLLDGTADMVLGDGPHPIAAGDCVVLRGGDHALRPGADGCRLVAFSVGTPPA